jgi:hypothetical protein
MIKKTKSTLLNIDSSNRDKIPKNIFISNNNYLPNNPITFIKDNNEIIINYPNHELKENDKIIIQNVEGKTKTLINSFYLINSYNYLIIDFIENHDISLDYLNYNKDIYINIDILSDYSNLNMINNIPLNSILGIKKIKLLSDVYNNILINDLFKKYDNNKINKLLFIELPFQFNQTGDSYYIINEIFKITFLNISGIDLGYINSNYPINSYNYQSSQIINRVIDKDNITIILKKIPYKNMNGGGNKIQIMKILNSITSYPYTNEYTIKLNKNFTNITKIELISSEFPYVDLLIKENVNDKLYWKILEDGPYIYSITIDEGTYNSDTLVNKIKLNMNKTKRITYTVENPVYNIFDINIEQYTQEIKFYCYKETKLPNSLNISEIIIDNVKYYLLTIVHPNNFVDIGDTITISGASDTSIKYEYDNKESQILLISSSYINKSHIIYKTDNISKFYSIILGRIDQIQTEVAGSESKGGQNISIKSKTKASFLFNKNDTIGEILGFKNVSDANSITDFQFIISNKDPYIISTNLNSVGDIIKNNNIINLSGNYNYFFMYLNDIEYIYTNNKIPSAFSKILLNGNPGTILFNTFVNQPNDLYSKSFPISTLNELNIKFLFPDGSKPDFRNLNHSFTLRIIEEIIESNEFYNNSNNINVYQEFKKI